MKTRILVLYTILLLIGLTCGAIALIDVFNEQTLWSEIVTHKYIMDAIIFLSGAVTTITSVNKIDGRNELK